MQPFQLTIPEPCHANWQAMSPDERGRFCQACRKTVIDFSQFTDAQLARYFEQAGEQVCGRFRPDQLNRGLLTPKKPMPGLRQFFALVLPALLVSMKIQAQGKVMVKPVDTVQAPRPVRLGRVLVKPAAPTITVQVVDQKGAGVPFATLMKKGTTVGLSTNEDGRATLPQDWKGSRVVASALGFVSRELVVGEQATLQLALSEMIMGGIALVPVEKPQTPKAKKQEPKKQAQVEERRPSNGKEPPLVEKQAVNCVTNSPAALTKLPPTMPSLKPALPSLFRVVPNPVSSGGILQLETNELPAGNYTLQLLTSTGELVKAWNLPLRAHQRQALALPTIPAGPYFLVLIQPATQQRFSDIVMVQ